MKKKTSVIQRVKVTCTLTEIPDIKDKYINKLGYDMVDHGVASIKKGLVNLLFERDVTVKFNAFLRTMTN